MKKIQDNIASITGKQKSSFGFINSIKLLDNSIYINLYNKTLRK